MLTTKQVNAIAVTGLVTLFAGCEDMPTRFVDLSAEERTLAAQIPVYREQLPKDSYIGMQEVRGVSCEAGSDEGYRASEKDAIEELQRATYVAGGNAVMGVTCGSSDQNRGDRTCFRSFICSGTAVKTGR